MPASIRVATLVMFIVVALMAGACAAAGDRTPTVTSAAVPSAIASAATTASVAPTPASSPSAAAASGADVIPIAAGSHAAHVVGGGSYPSFTVVVPGGWYDGGGHFVVKYPGTDQPGPVMGLSVWDVGQVPREPLSLELDAGRPGPERRRNSWRPWSRKRSAMLLGAFRRPLLAGYPGRYLEWSVPADAVVDRRWGRLRGLAMSREGHARLRQLVRRRARCSRWRAGRRARSTGCGCSTSTGSDWSSTRPTHPTPPRPTETSLRRSWLRSGSRLARRLWVGERKHRCGMGRPRPREVQDQQHAPGRSALQADRCSRGAAGPLPTIRTVSWKVSARLLSTGPTTPPTRAPHDTLTTRVLPPRPRW